MSYLCKITTSRAPFLPLSFSFSHLKTRENVGGVLVVCSIHAHVQHLMHLRQSDLHVFNFYFPCPTSRFGKMKFWGGGIGCQIQSLQFYSPHFLPQNSGKCNSRGWGVIFVQNYNIHLRQVNYMFFLCRFPFATSKLEKM